ncbi:MAG: pectinesterase, partial [Clostridia bacterium]|nr:pectinesterase [Clostridia bacterium]
MSKLDRELLQLFRKVRDRIHSNLILNYGVIGAAIALGCSLLAALLSRFIPIYAVYSKGALGVMAAALAAIVYGAFKTPGNRQVALKVDSLGLQERTLTAVELIGEESTFATLEKQDALMHLKTLNFKKALPIRPNRKHLALCAILTAVLTVSAFIPNPMAEKARELNQLKQEIAKQQKKITEVEKKVAKNAKLTSEQKKEAEAKLQELKKELKAAQNKKDIDKALQKSQKKLEYLSDKYTDSKENLEKLMNTLAKNQETKRLADMIRNSSEKELKDNFKQFAEQLKKMDKEQLKQLAKSISELTEQIKNNPELMQALRELAEKLGSGELGDVSEALDQLGESIADMMSDESFGSAMQELAKQLGEMQQGQQGQQDQSGTATPGNGSQDGGGQQTPGQG